MNVVKPIVSFLGQCRREAGGSWRLRIHMNIPLSHCPDMTEKLLNQPVMLEKQTQKHIIIF